VSFFGSFLDKQKRTYLKSNFDLLGKLHLKNVLISFILSFCLDTKRNSRKNRDVPKKIKNEQCTAWSFSSYDQQLCKVNSAFKGQPFNFSYNLDCFEAKNRITEVEITMHCCSTLLLPAIRL